MPRTETIEETIYTFDELSDRAKEKARQWFREASSGDDVSEYIYEDAAECGKILGIEIASRSQRWVVEGTDKTGVDTRPAIFYSGFWPQGDGACFEGSYSYAKGAAEKIRKHAPANPAGGEGPRDANAVLHAIADELQVIQAKHQYKLTATMKHSGHYYHSGCMAVETCDASGDYAPAEAYEAVRDCMRRFADWIYRQLESGYEYQNSDATVDENIRCNEYEFDQDGNRA